MKLAKSLGIGAGIIIVIVIALLLALPHFVNLESFRPRIEDAASKALKREVKVEGIHLQLFPSFGAGLSRLSVADRAGFGLISSMPTVRKSFARSPRKVRRPSSSRPK